jgi:hypothetical protein
MVDFTMKPKVFYADESFSHEGLFSEQSKEVSISIDTFKLDDTTPFRVYLESEPPEVRDTVSEIINNHQFYNLILAWDERVIKACPNAEKFVAYSAPWCCSFTPGKISHRRGMQNRWVEADGDITKKEFLVSYLTSDKNWCPGHILRQQIFEALPEKVGNLPILKHRSPGTSTEAKEVDKALVPDKIGFLEKPQFSIAVENSIHINNFTEKILDCFLTKTVPLYWGCPNLSEFFNMDSVLVFDTYDCLVNLLKNLTPEYYETHKIAVEDNYSKAMQYVDYFGRVDNAIRENLNKTQTNEPRKIQRMLRRADGRIQRRF